MSSSKYFHEGEIAVRKDNLQDYAINYSQYVTDAIVDFATNVNGKQIVSTIYTGWVYSSDNKTGLFQNQLMKKYEPASSAFQIELKKYLE